jgi:hypothetical protein
MISKSMKGCPEFSRPTSLFLVKKILCYHLFYCYITKSQGVILVWACPWIASDGRQNYATIAKHIIHGLALPLFEKQESSGNEERKLYNRL